MSEAPAPASWRGPLIAFAAALTLYVVSASPVVHWGDSAELSRRAISLELLPTARGYPLHRLLTWTAGRICGDPAYGANLVSAVFGAVSVALVYELGRRLGRSAWAGATAAVVTGLAHTFWAYSAVAEVYSLHTSLMLGAMLLAVACDSGRSRTQWALGAVLGLSLLHHRMIVFCVPGIVFWLWTGLPAGSRLRAAGRVVLGALAGALPFAVLCLVASRSPPAGTEDRVWWWFQDVFMGGERNADYLLGEGRKGLAASAVYLAKFFVFNLPGPALLLAGIGFARGGRRIAVFLAIEAAATIWFPLRYDWTGDQYTFLIPLYPVFALAAAVGVGWLERTRGPRAAAWSVAAATAAPLVLYTALAWTGLGAWAFPGLTPRAAHAMLWPPRTGDRTPRDWCAERLKQLPPNARLHADWGDGEVDLYLQDAEGLRRDVTVDVWNTTIRLGDGSGEEWLSVLPLTRDLPKPVGAVMHRLEHRGDGLFRVLPK